MDYTKVYKDTQKYTDADIIEEILSGNTPMFEILIRRYNPVLYKTGRGYGFGHQDTEDLMQETFISSYQGLSGFEHRSSFKTWIIKIMLNQCYHKSQKASYQKKSNVEISVNEITSTMFLKTNHSDTDNSVLNKELSKIIEATLNKLPVEYRMIFTMRELNGLNTAETAGALNISTSNVKVRLNRAKAMLRKEIEAVYSPNDIFEFNLVYCDKIVDAVMKKISDHKNI
jgi:RNA polymerase sigma factor (sigma-70 family)